MKSIISVILAILMLLSPAAYQQDPAEACDCTQDVLLCFEGIAQVPRPSHHEEKICAYLCEWAAAQGFEYKTDEQNNVIIEVPATTGMESREKIALQCHMDMVFAQKDGLDLNAEETSITVVNDGTFLRSDGNTSLGADDGIGLAIAMNICEGKMAHGPIRLIVTTDEEDGCTGAFGLDPAYVSDIRYLINIDYEEEGVICLSTSASVLETCTKDVTCAAPSGDTAVKIEISNLRGGHSGLEIVSGRLNAIAAMPVLLAGLDEASVSYELAELNGGSASNAIATACSAVIYVNGEDSAKAQEILLQKAQEIQTAHADTDPDMTVSVTISDPSTTESKALSAEDKAEVLALLSNLTNGVVTMSEDVDGLVESSSNLGLAAICDGRISIVSLVRSSSSARLEEITSADRAAAEGCGFAYDSERSADPWPYDPDNRLMELADEAYAALFGEELRHMTVHAGLECGTFAVYNPDLEMISLGPTIYDAHTTNERLEISSIDRVWKLLEEILSRI